VRHIELKQNSWLCR